jgi:hypothetical protein
MGIVMMSTFWLAQPLFKELGRLNLLVFFVGVSRAAYLPGYLLCLHLASAHSAILLLAVTLVRLSRPADGVVRSGESSRAVSDGRSSGIYAGSNAP